MKKYLSIMWLGLKTTWWKLLIVFATVAFLDLIMYDRMVIAAVEAGENIPFKKGLDNVVLEFCWMWGIIALFIIFRLTGRKGRAQERYTIQRLLIKENTFIFLNELYYLLVIILFWVLNIGIIYILGKWHLDALGLNMHPSFINSLYKNELAQEIIPLGNIPRIIRNIAIFYALSAGCAEGARQERYCGTGGRGLYVFFGAIYVLINCLKYPSGVHMGWNPLTTDPLFIILALVYLVFTKLRMYREEE